MPSSSSATTTLTINFCEERDAGASGFSSSDLARSLSVDLKVVLGDVVVHQQLSSSLYYDDDSRTAAAISTPPPTTYFFFRPLHQWGRKRSRP